MMARDVCVMMFSLLFVLFSKALCLFCDEFCVVKIVDAHGVPYFFKSLCAYTACLLCAFLEDFVYARNVFLVFFASLSYRLKTVVEHVIEKLLACAVAKTSLCVMCFQLIEIFIFWKEFLKVRVKAECVEISEDCVAFEVTRLFDMDVLWVSVHGVDLLLQFFRRVGEVDAVAE